MTTIDTTTPTGEQRGGTHPVVIGHLVMGLAFLGVVTIWLVSEFADVSVHDVRWLLPLPWVFAGTVGLLAVVLAGRRRSAQRVVAPYAVDEAHLVHDDTPTTIHDETPEEEQR
ncbi:MAG: hypothetical protein KDB63_00375 [Nocardioidaceae bacterium]|nr:hypothetical protein [Nocardioidaceae bacterium]